MSFTSSQISNKIEPRWSGYLDCLYLLPWPQFSVSIISIIYYPQKNYFILDHETLVRTEFVSLQNTNLYVFRANTCRNFHGVLTGPELLRFLASEISRTNTSISVVWRKWASFFVETNSSCPQNVSDPLFSLKIKSKLFCDHWKGPIFINWIWCQQVADLRYPHKQGYHQDSYT